MIRTAADNRAPADPPPQPAWEIARLFPYQGQWSEEDYLSLHTNHLVEFSGGRVNVLPVPTTSHQLIVQFLSNLLLGFVTPAKLGTVLFAPLRVRLWAEKFREPDVVFMFRRHAARIQEQFWDGADLVMEIVSETEEDRQRDYEAKRADYERAGIPEYWIVDPQLRRITILKFLDGRYVTHGEFGLSERAESALLPGFTVDVSATFAAGEVGAGA